MTTPETVRVDADHTVIKRLGNWTTARAFEVHSRRGYVLLDLRSPQIPDGDIEIHVTLDRAMVKLLVPEDAVIDTTDLRWHRGRLKDWTGRDRTDGRRIRITGQIGRGEIRIHRGGIAILSAMASRAFVKDALRAHLQGTPITVLDPANPVSERKDMAGQVSATYDEHVAVLIVGGGYAGLASSLFLAHHGIGSLLVDRHSPFSVQGRARAINWRTMEIYRPLGVAESILEEGKPFDDQSGVARCTTLSSEWEWLYDAEEPRTFPELSGARFCMADQNMVEPILIEAALSHGADQRFNTTMVSFDTDADGVTAVIEDRSTQQRRTVRAGYLVAADGARSPIRHQLGIDRSGRGVLKHWISIVFEADLVIKKDPLFCIVLNEELGRDASFLSTAVPGRWALSITYDPATESVEDFTPERCVDLIRIAAGIPKLAVTVLDTGFWEEAVGVADRYRDGRVLFAGDSAHVWPPAGGMGANSAVQDAHNLAWKLAAVIKGYADASLLDTYQDERRPVAEELSRLTMRRQQARFSNDEEYVDDVDDMVCVLGQRYQSAAVIGAIHESVFGAKLDLHGRPGERAPHLVVDQAGTEISVHDLFHDSFVLLTGSAGARWVDAAERTAKQLSVPLQSFQVGSDSEQVDLVDVEHQWHSRYGVGIDGAVLVRPDGYVAWRSDTAADDPSAVLGQALHHILGR